MVSVVFLWSDAFFNKSKDYAVKYSACYLFFLSRTRISKELSSYSFAIRFSYLNSICLGNLSQVAGTLHDNHINEDRFTFFLD